MGWPTYLRRPPPPPERRRDGSLMVVVPSPIANTEQGKSKIIGGKRKRKRNWAYLNIIRSRPYYLRRCKQKGNIILSTSTIESLPDDLLFEILVKLPAEHIYNGAMLVHRNWYRMVHTRAFTHAHLQNSTRGILLEINSGFCTFLVIGQGGRVEISKLTHRLYLDMWGCCNGLIMQCNIPKNQFYITNPVTGQHFGLPPHPDRWHLGGFTFRSGLGYAPSSMQYKAVLCYETNTSPFNCIILTVGVDDTWRNVCTHHISSRSFGAPQITQGFMHWCSETHVVSLDLETEIMTQTPVPPDVGNKCYRLSLDYMPYVKTHVYLSTTGKSLSLLVWLSQLCWDMWEMRAETGEWTKIQQIDLEPQRCGLEEHLLLLLRSGGEQEMEEHRQDPMVLVPAGWLEYKEVLLFYFAHRTRVCVVVYNVRTQVIDSFDLGCKRRPHHFHLHTNSLEWLVG